METTSTASLKAFFDEKVARYNKPTFIKDDPVCVPHMFSKNPDIEISGFFAAIFAWGNRATIISKSKELMQLMDGAPYDFCRNHQPSDLKRLETFKHRTFNTTDLLYFVSFFQYHYSKHKSLETAFLPVAKNIVPVSETVPMENYLTYFHNYFFSLEYVPNRTRKHIATPYRGSSCKRLNMFLRWMVRNDNKGVDLGIWKKVSPAQLICPIDVHVARVAKRFNLLHRKQIDWQAAVELTAYLRTLDPQDPVKYDFALFGLGAIEKF